jgi:GTP-sensing pleiotropic transcriptional regulator CodY
MLDTINDKCTTKRTTKSKKMIMGRRLNQLYKDKIFEDNLENENGSSDYYEQITDTEREIMSYLDIKDIHMVKPQERKSVYFQRKKTPTLLLPKKISHLFRRRF